LIQVMVSSWVGWMLPQQLTSPQQARQNEGSAQRSVTWEDSSRHHLQVGDRVEYYSTGYEDWIDAQIVGVYPDGQLLDLDIKKGIPVERVRLPQLDGNKDHVHPHSVDPEESQRDVSFTEYRQSLPEGTSVASEDTRQHFALQDIITEVRSMIKVHIELQDNRINDMFQEERRTQDELVKDMRQLRHRYDELVKNMNQQLSEVTAAVRRDMSSQQLALSQYCKQQSLLFKRVSSAADIIRDSKLSLGVQNGTLSVDSSEIEESKLQQANQRRTIQKASEDASEEKGSFALAAADDIALENTRLLNTPEMTERTITASGAFMQSIGTTRISEEESPGGFQVPLNRIAGQHLGMVVEAQESDSLCVLSLDDSGVVMSWNKRNPACAVQVGDQIIKVNDAVGVASRLQEELGQAELLVLTIHRPSAVQKICNM